MNIVTRTITAVILAIAASLGIAAPTQAASTTPGDFSAFLTSSAETESAQESDRIRASYFTHYLISGFRGAADLSGDGSIVDLGGPVLDPPGYDLRGALVGSEGTLCIVVEVTLRILRKPEATRTFFATFPSTTEAGHAVSYIIAAGIVPAAIEMMDRLAIEAIKAATGVDWPDVGAALLMDVDGTAAEVEHTAQEATELARKAGAMEIRIPRDAAERETMWRGRKSAFAAVGRISPNYVVQDGVIPRSEIARW